MNKYFTKLILALIVVIFLTSCNEEREFEYLGNYPELFSVAINSILGTRGYRQVGLGGKDNPSIRILEKDDYGRILFSYSEGTISYVIMQKVDGNYVYFYPYYNFISRQGVWNSTLEPRPERMGGFSNEDRRVLKEINNWNQPMSDSSEFVRARIVHRKEDGLVSDDKLVEVYKLIIPETRLNTRHMVSNMVFFRTDSYGRAIYSIGEIVVLFQPDHSFDIETGLLKRADRFNYQTELRLFMEANGWDTPFEE